MAYIPMVRSLVLRPHMDLLKRLGSRCEPLLEASGLSWALESDPETLIPLGRVCDFYCRAGRREGEELTFRAVEECDTVRLQTRLTAILLREKTPGAALRKISQMVHPINPSLRSWAVVRGNHVWACNDYIGGLGPGRAFAIHYALVSLIHYARLLTGPDWRPDEVLLQLPPTSWLSRMGTLAGSRIRFNQPVNAIRLPLKALAQPFPLDQVTLSELAPVSAASTSVDLVESLRQFVQWRLQDGLPTVSEAADVAGVSARSLQRELAIRGQSFSTVLDHTRFEMARKALEHPESKVVNVAFELGFTDSANFTRAFRRWTGFSPREWRLLRTQ